MEKIRENYHVKYDTARNIISSRFHDAHQILTLHVRQTGGELLSVREICVRES